MSKRLSAMAFLAFAALPALCAGTPASAADGAPHPVDQGRRRPSDQAEAPVGLEEVVVTARKRDEDVQSTPVSITAFTGAQIERQGVRTIADLQRQTPSLRISPHQGEAFASLVSIRGQVQTNIIMSLDPSVGIYYDGVYVGSNQGTSISNLFDIGRVEILKGPQGTLYGRNTTGGTISIFTNPPSAVFEGEVKVGGGDHGYRVLDGMVNMPLDANGSALRIVVQDSEGGAFGKDFRTGQAIGVKREASARAALKLEPTDKLELVVRAEAGRGRSNGVLATPAYLAPGSPANLEIAAELFGAINAVTLGRARDAYAAEVARGIYSTTTSPTQPVGSKLDYWNASVTGTYDLAQGLTFRSITAFRYFRTDRKLDLDGTEFSLVYSVNQTDQKLFTQEFQLNGDALDHRLKYVLGAYYYATDAFDGGPGVSLTALNPLITDNSPKLFTRSPAAYGQGTFAILPSLNFTGGLRWTQDRKKLISHAYTLNARTGVVTCVLPEVQRTGICTGVFRTSAEDLSYTAGLDWTPLPDVMLYAKTSKGFKGGGLNQRPTPNPLSTLPFAPETIVDYEVGLKSEFFDHRLRFDVSAFDSHYRNIQRVANVSSSGMFVSIIRNAARATISGLEAEATATPTRGLVLRAAVGRTQPRYEEYFSGAQDLSRQAFQNVPKFTSSLSAAYSAEVGPGRLTGELYYSYQSMVDLAPTGFLVLPDSVRQQPAYGLLDATLSLETASGVTARLLVKNLLNKRYVLGQNELVSAGLGSDTNLPGPPRTVALEVTKSF